MLELLNQLDGFDYRGDVKVIMATNRIETLDPALIRPGTLLPRAHVRGNLIFGARERRMGFMRLEDSSNLF